jgi:hypothetical protein
VDLLGECGFFEKCCCLVLYVRVVGTVWRCFGLYRVFGVSVATQTYIFLGGAPGVFFRFWKALVRAGRRMPHLMGLASTVGGLFALLCPDKPNFEGL